MILRALVLLAAIAQFVVPGFLNPFRDGGADWQSSDGSQIEPAGYAFSIWGIIYLGALAYAIWQVTPSGRKDPATARIAPFAIIVYLGSSIWLAAASRLIPLVLTIPILAIMAASAITALIIAVQTQESSRVRMWLASIPFGFYAGWTVCATFVNIAEVAPLAGFNRFGLSVPAFGVASITAATLTAAFVLSRTRGHLTFALTIAWALIAIIVAAQTRPYDGSITIAAGVALVTVALLTAVLKLRRRAA